MKNIIFPHENDPETDSNTCSEMKEEINGYNIQSEHAHRKRLQYFHKYCTFDKNSFTFSIESHHERSQTLLSLSFASVRMGRLMTVINNNYVITHAFQSQLRVGFRIYLYVFSSRFIFLTRLFSYRLVRENKVL